MASDELPSSPLDPHNPLASQQSRDAYLTARRRETLELPAGVEHLHLPPREQIYPAEINLSDIPLSVAMRREPNTTPIGRWLQAVEPMSPTNDPALRPASHWSSDSEPTTLSDSNSWISKLHEKAAHNFEFNRRDLSSPEGISPTNPGYRAAGIQPFAGSSSSRPFPASPSKRPMKTSPNEKSTGRLQGKKKHVPPPILTNRRIAVVIPLSKLRQGKPTTRKGKVSSQKAVLAPSGSALRPCNQPIFCCPICGFRLPLLTAINQHIRDNHPRAYNPTNGDVNDHEHEPSENHNDAVALPRRPIPRYICIALINDISSWLDNTHFLRMKTYFDETKPTFLGFWRTNYLLSVPIPENAHKLVRGTWCKDLVELSLSDVPQESAPGAIIKKALPSGNS
ncbi:hypothetical protein PSTG_05449 [Puccinia striiformis f. sp. tritici PST-78]|uniref:C2H2-type domain-containing protein n=1 Tax=Puccinia striiformis f. sp. tritici PST-78 TaxID=1165861 RepID=A0A0L0VQ00_9BASI|nr:hypothetical protein PSTG_05449 [Puccinia striiformis f. sp. tritici PST-78]